MKHQDNSRLASAIVSATLALKAELAATRFIIELHTLERHLRKANFNPNQPRDPAGTPRGGQWSGRGKVKVGPTKIPGWPARKRSVRPHRSPGFYYFDLRKIESKRSHGWSRHVGKTPEQLLATIMTTVRPTVEPDGSPGIKHQASLGSFVTEGEANSLVAAALRNHPDLVEHAVQGSYRVQITHDFGFQTGIEAYWGRDQDVPIVRPTQQVRVLISYDPTPGSRGYTVITAFPMNDIPNEVFNDRYQNPPGFP